MSSVFFQAVAATIIASSIPLILAAIGELVAERSGMLNLGVEGMMLMGAVCGFIGAYFSGSTLIGALCGVAAGMAMAALYGLLTIGFAVNQVAAGLALTIFGQGLSGLVGAHFVGLKRDGAPHLHLPWLSDLPYIGHMLFGEDGFAYVAVGLVAGVAWFLRYSRAGLDLRAVGDNPASAHALGMPVGGIRLKAVLFGGACAGLSGAYLTLAYTPFWSPGLSAGRGWIALALVVFASWKPWRVVLGALLFGGATILQLQAQALGIRLPSQMLSALPYVVTILALILLNLRRNRGSLTPAALGLPFVADT